MFRQKKVVSLLCALFMVSALFFVPSFSSNAASVRQFEVSYAEPGTSDTQGYINLLFKNDSTSDYMIWTYFWYCAAEKNGVVSPCYAVIDLKPTSFTFSVGGVGSATSAYYNLNAIYALGQFGNIKASGTSAYSRTFSGWTIVGCKFAGNVGEFNSTIGDTEFSVLYSKDASAILLQDIFNVLNESASLDADLYNVVYDIYNSVDSVEGKLNSVVTYLKSVDSKLGTISSSLSSLYARAGEILEEQKETNTWLEKIFDYLNESQEQQKNEAQTQGGNSVSQGNSAIEDKGGDFASSLGGLTNSMSYTGTQCAWEFPEVKMPAISGVMDEVVLIRSQPIDFSVWVNAIPAGILLLVQSVCTSGLIVFCFIELYSTIAYVLTLRKDDNS